MVLFFGVIVRLISLGFGFLEDREFIKLMFWLFAGHEVIRLMF